MFCPQCGAALPDGANFCTACGTRLASPGPAQPFGYGAGRDYGRIAPGYSRLVDSDAVRRALKKQKNAGGIASVIVVCLPFLGFVIYGALSDSMEIGRAAQYGLIVSAVFLLFALISFLKKKGDKPFEGVVADMKEVTRRVNDETRGGRTRTKWLVWFDCSDGRRRKKEVSLYTFEYLRPGDRVRYLPQFPQPYEKYDKSRDSEIMCMFCGRRQDIGADTCSFCHNLIIK